jgi:glutamate-ammonia-ligase adenylyltransferase
MQVSDHLSWLAESMIAAVIYLVTSRLQEKHGTPHCVDKCSAKRRATQLAVVAYGKLGGYELGFGSDLDLVFLHDSRGEKQLTDGQKPIENSLYYSRLTQKFVHFMNTATPAGVLYDIDLRLRPNGSSGVLVTGIDAFAKYQQAEAWTWEHQALMRARVVYGSPSLHQRFDGIRQAVLAQPRSEEQLRIAVASMRERMRKALGNKDPDRMHLKQDAGGVADIEFVVQYLVLANAAQYPQLLQYTDNFRVLQIIDRLSLVGQRDVSILTDSYLALREHLHHLALQELPAIVDMDEKLAAQRDRVVEIRSRILADG